MEAPAVERSIRAGVRTISRALWGLRAGNFWPLLLLAPGPISEGRGRFELQCDVGSRIVGEFHGFQCHDLHPLLCRSKKGEGG